MESRVQHLHVAIKLMLSITLLLPQASFAATDPDELELEPLVIREDDRRQVDVDQIDSEDFEIGAYGGIMSIEDFGSDTVVGVRAAYHVTEDFFIEGVYGQSTLGETSFETLSGGARLLTDEERDFTYYNLSVGVNLFPGESFLARRWAWRGGLYLIGGIGSSEFGGDELFTYNAGIGYRLAATDWLAFRFDVRDHVFSSDLLGSEETKHNLEISGGLTIFF
ncbi:MAG: outer membrane beta-barrel domain-containing protein [Pseudomonadaceae bacterium]|nr:outer membrane beta-barrel domain-containing protein [Pseudomonadaceae bacterium]